MTYTTVRLRKDVVETLDEMKHVYRERSLSDALAHIFHDLGIEPYDEDEYDDDEGE